MLYKWLQALPKKDGVKKAAKKGKKTVLAVPRPSSVLPSSQGSDTANVSFDVIELSQSSNSSEGSNIFSQPSSQSFFDSQSQKSNKQSQQYVPYN